MLPGSSSTDANDERLRDAVLPRERTSRCAGRVLATDAHDSRFRQFRSRDALSYRVYFWMQPATARVSSGHSFRMQPRPASVSARLPPLAVSVRHIVRCRTEKQMIRIAARRIVAFVEHVEPIRNGTVGDPPCHAMRAFPLAAPVSNTVSKRILRSGPRPTTSGVAAMIDLSRKLTLLARVSSAEVRPLELCDRERPAALAANAHFVYLLHVESPLKVRPGPGR